MERGSEKQFFSLFYIFTMRYYIRLSNRILNYIINDRINVEIYTIKVFSSELSKNIKTYYIYLCKTMQNIIIIIIRTNHKKMIKIITLFCFNLIRENN